MLPACGGWLRREGRTAGVVALGLIVKAAPVAALSAAETGAAHRACIASQPDQCIFETRSGGDQASTPALRRSAASGRAATDVALQELTQGCLLYNMANAIPSTSSSHVTTTPRVTPRCSLWRQNGNGESRGLQLLSAVVCVLFSSCVVMRARRTAAVSAHVVVVHAYVGG